MLDFGDTECTQHGVAAAKADMILGGTIVPKQDDPAPGSRLPGKLIEKVAPACPADCDVEVNHTEFV